MTQPAQTARHPLARLLALFALLMLFGLATASLLSKSPTFDEGFYIARGWAFWRTGRLLQLGHPALASLLAGLGPLLEPNLPHPSALAGWVAGNPETLSEDLLWGRGLDAGRMVFLARMPFVLLGLLLGALVWRWGSDRYGAWGGTLALGLLAFSPTMLAHTRLAATDVAVAAFFVATLYAWDRYLARRSAGWLVALGVFFGLAQATKFSALLLGPTLGVMALVAAYRQGGIGLRGGGRLLNPRGWLASTLVVGAAVGMVALATVWAAHLFTLQPLYLNELDHFLGLASGGHRGYLLGRFSTEGWWYYHLVALGLKLTEPALLLVALAGATALLGWRWQPAEWHLVFPALLYIGVTLLIRLNVGVRYLLPAIILLFLFTGRLTTIRWRSPAPAAAIGVLGAAHALIAVVIFPHYIPYFNQLAGGPEQGWRALVDSNVDWGQDLPALAGYMRANELNTVKLSYFGQADPAYYGITYDPLPAWPPPGPPTGFVPLDPAPGTYAISASNLVGVQLLRPDSFGLFLTRQPDATLGHSIHIYEVSEAALPFRGQVTQCADRAVESEEDLRALNGGRAVTITYLDCANGLPVYPTERSWLLLPPAVAPPLELGPADFIARNPDGQTAYSGWSVGAPYPYPSTTEGGIAGVARLDGFTMRTSGQTISLTVGWRVEQSPPPPVSFLAHLIGPGGQLIAAGDALSVPLDAWQPGMQVNQRHTFDLPPDAGVYTLVVGMYNLATGERLPTYDGGDSIVLTTITIDH